MQRTNYIQHLQQEMELLNQLEGLIRSYDVGEHLIELMKLRVSQINGCSFCVSLHTQKLRRGGETNERIDLVAAWQEAPCYTEKERSALRWAEALTTLADQRHISDELYEQTVAAFDEATVSQLTLAVAVINTWNRFAVAFRTDHAYVRMLLEAA